MDVIEDDGAPWSYLAASLVARELLEYGAMWHGIGWGTYEIQKDSRKRVPRPKNSSQVGVSTKAGARIS